MAMNMRRAFNAKMMVPLTLISVGEGSYDENNDWIPATPTTSTIYGRVIIGNKFSQFDAGIAKKIEDGGQRYADYRSLYIPDNYEINMTDQFTSATHLKGRVFSILNEADESIFGFRGFLLEAEEENYVIPYTGSYATFVGAEGLTGDPNSVAVYPGFGGTIEPNLQINGEDLFIYSVFGDIDNQGNNKFTVMTNTTGDMHADYTVTVDGTDYVFTEWMNDGYTYIQSDALYDYLLANINSPLEFNVVEVV